MVLKSTQKVRASARGHMKTSTFWRKKRILVSGAHFRNAIDNG